MSFEFIRELSEARLFRNPKKLSDMDMSELADNFFSVVLALQILRHADPKTAARYAQQTMAGNALDGWRSSGSDIHNMAIMLKNPERYKDKLDVDRRVSLPELQYKTWLRNISQGKDDSDYDRRFLFKLQQGLGITSGVLRMARRTVADWDDSDAHDRKLAATRVNLGLKQGLQSSDIYALYFKIMSKKELLLRDLPDGKSGH